MSYDFTARDVILKIRELATANPGNVYCADFDGCHYSRGRCRDGSIGCIFGQALLALGVDPEKLAKFDRDGGVGAGNALDALGVRYTELQRRWMAHAQQSQDDMLSWGEAVGIADASINPAKGLQEFAT